MKTSNIGEARFDIVKWLFIIGLGILAGFGNYTYQAQPLSLRLIGLLLIGLSALAVATQTRLGGRVIHFTKLSRNELRKVVWPDRSETVRTTLIVVAMIVVASIFMWCLDASLLLAVGLLTR